MKPLALSITLLTMIGCIETDTKDPDTAALVDADGDGFGESEDCDDDNASIYPGADEICDDFDNNCDGIIDEGLIETFYADADDDGYGDPNNPTEDCSRPSGHVADRTDCDDSNNQNNPNAVEICDGDDNNCNGSIDEGTTITYYVDSDEDGYGNPIKPIEACEAPSGYVSDNTDCDDTNSAIYYDAPELLDGVDNNCDNVLATEVTIDDIVDVITLDGTQDYDWLGSNIEPLADIDGDGIDDFWAPSWARDESYVFLSESLPTPGTHQIDNVTITLEGAAYSAVEGWSTGEVFLGFRNTRTIYSFNLSGTVTGSRISYDDQLVYTSEIRLLGNTSFSSGSWRCFGGDEAVLCDEGASKWTRIDTAGFNAVNSGSDVFNTHLWWGTSLEDDRIQAFDNTGVTFSLTCSEDENCGHDILTADVAGNSQDELIVGASGIDEAWVWTGSGGPPTDMCADTHCEAPAIAWSHVIEGAADSEFGNAFARLEYDNGLNVLAVAAREADHDDLPNVGAVYLFVLDRLPKGNLTVADADLVIYGNESGERFGVDLLSSDVDGDGVLDLIISADLANDEAGEIHIIPGYVFSDR